MGLIRDWRSLLKWSWLIPWCAVLCLSASYLALAVIPISYEATATLHVDLPLDAQIGVPAITPSTVLAGLKQDATSPACIALAVQQLPTMVPAQVASALNVTAVASADVLSVAARAKTPEEAARIANAVAGAVLKLEAQKVQQDDSQGEQGLRTQINAARSTIASLQAQITALQEQGVGANNPTIVALQTQLATQNSTYSQLMTTLAQLQYYEGLQHPGLQVEQTAEATTAAQQPDERKVLVGSLLAGAALGILLAAVAARRRTRITARTVQSLPGLSGCPVWRLPSVSVAEKNPADQIDVAAVPAAVSMQQVVISLTVAGAVTPLKSLLLAGVESGVGTSRMAASLAQALAANGKRVILVDADLKHPTQETRLGLLASPGLGAALAATAGGSVELEHYLQDTPLPFLKVVPAGPPLDEERRLLASGGMGLVIDKLLSGAAEMVIFDAPPVSPRTGTVALAERVDGIILVADEARTSLYRLERALAGLGGSSSVLRGLLLTGSHSPGRKGQRSRAAQRPHK